MGGPAEASKRQRPIPGGRGAGGRGRDQSERGRGGQSGSGGEASKRPRPEGSNSITHLAKLHWPAAGGGTFDAAVVDQLYGAHLKKAASLKRDSSSQATALEVSGYLEQFLWPNLDPETSSWSHIMSIVVLINLKFREGVSAWASLRSEPVRFTAFFARVLELPSERTELAFDERSQWTQFLIHCFQSLENEMVRPQALRLVSLPMWSTLNPRSLTQHLAGQPQLQQPWKFLQKRRKKVHRSRVPSKWHCPPPPPPPPPPPQPCVCPATPLSHLRMHRSAH